MSVCIIKDVLDQTELDQINQVLDRAKFDDGKLTASGLAKAVKTNKQLNRGSNKDLLAALSSKILDHNQVSLFTFADRIKEMTISSYSKGMGYGDHLDKSIQAGMRTDYSCTLFLTPPESYEGGELVIETELGGLSQFKLEAGSALLYSSGLIHRVNEVISGERRVAISWLGSKIKDSGHRDIFRNLNVTLSLLRKQPESAENHKIILKLMKAINNLERLWSGS